MTPLRRYYRGHNLVAMRDVQAGATSYYHFDHQGTTQCLTNSAGTVTDRFASDAWGVQVKRTGSSNNRQWYIGNLGYYRQKDQMLDYVRARYLDVMRAGWASRDPICWRSHISALYTYARSSPVNRLDATGLWCAIAHPPFVGYSTFFAPPYVCAKQGAGCFSFNPPASLDTFYVQIQVVAQLDCKKGQQGVKVTWHQSFVERICKLVPNLFTTVSGVSCSDLSNNNDGPDAGSQWTMYQQLQPPPPVDFYLTYMFDAPGYHVTSGGKYVADCGPADFLRCQVFKSWFDYEWGGSTPGKSVSPPAYWSNCMGTRGGFTPFGPVKPPFISFCPNSSIQWCFPSLSSPPIALPPPGTVCP